MIGHKVIVTVEDLDTGDITRMEGNLEKLEVDVSTPTMTDLLEVDEQNRSHLQTMPKATVLLRPMTSLTIPNVVSVF